PWRDHWEKSAHSLLTGAILHVLYAEEEKTLSRVAAFLADPARSVRRTMWVMLTTNHLGTEGNPRAHPTVASAARELLNKTDNERSGVVSTAMTLLGLYRDPIVARMTSGSDWRIADLLGAARPVSLYLVVPPSDISRTRPLVRLILNQIGRRLTERYDAHHADANARQLLFLLDEFPALGRLDFFESALAYLAAYRVRAFLVAQSLHQIDKAYGVNHSILDNCHVRVAFTYLFHRLEAHFDGRPTLLILDEAWTFLDEPLFAARIREWLKTLRKKNVAVVFATQSLADIERSAIAPALIESCPTRIFLPNDRALEPQARSVYERFGLNDRQIEILSLAAPKRDYYAQTARGNRLFELGLGPVALAFCGAGSPDDQRLIDRCLAHS